MRKKFSFDDVIMHDSISSHNTQEGTLINSCGHWSVTYSSPFLSLWVWVIDRFLFNTEYGISQ